MACIIAASTLKLMNHMPKKSAPNASPAAFQFSQDQFKALVAETLDQAKRLGAGEAVAEAMVARCSV